MELRAMLLILSILAMLSCTKCYRTSTVHEIISPSLQFPIKSFTQIFSGVEIKCIENKKKPSKCVNGWHYWTGSGAVIAQDANGSIVMTAGHVCVNNPPKKIAKVLKTNISIVDYSSRRKEAKIIHHIHKGTEDFCLLHVPDLFLPAVPLAKRGPLPGEKVYNMSAPRGRYHHPYPLLLEGLFSGNIYDGSTSLISIPSIGGVSGSPVLNSKMEIVGIVYATNLQFRFETLGTSYNSTLLFLREALKKHSEKIK